jgi:hypothetical protein
LTVRRAVVAAVVIVFAAWNLSWLGQLWDWATLHGLGTNDWSLLASLDPAHPFAGSSFHWSVPAAYLWAYVVVPMGFGAWTVLHFAALATVGDWRVVALALATFPFWADVASGNVLVFAFVFGWHALAGRRWAIVGFVVLAALVPRPLMVPVLAWLLWRSGLARVTFAAAAVTVVAAALIQGDLGTWLGRLVSTPANELAAPWNVGPSAIIGAAWIPVGIVLGAWLTYRGRLGLASLAFTPYVIHYYAIFALLELRLNDPVHDHWRQVQAAGRAGLGGVDLQLELGQREVGVDRRAAEAPSVGGA